MLIAMSCGFFLSFFLSLPFKNMRGNEIIAQDQVYEEEKSYASGLAVNEFSHIEHVGCWC